MINLRYHIVSLVAVFLALALGILIGTTVLDEGVVQLLEVERDRLAGHRDRLADENDDLAHELELWERFGRTIVPGLTAGRLQGRSITLLVQAEAEDRFLDEVLVALEHAGATVAGRITFSEKWALRDEPAREQLALVLGASTTDADELRRQAAADMARRLGTGGNAENQTDLLQSLARNGFLTLADLDGPDFPPQGSLGLMLTAADPSSMPPRDDFMMPFFEAVQDQLRFVVAEPLAAEDPVSINLRRDDVLSSSISTVDHADTLLGELSMIIALVDAGDGRLARHYGVEEGAATIVPPVGR